MIRSSDQRDILFSKLAKIQVKIGWNWRTKGLKMQNEVCKSNLNTNYRQMIDRTSLLTRLPRIWGFNSRGSKWICGVSSSVDVLCSRGNFDQIRWLITMNPALIKSRSSLNAGESWWTQDLPSNSLNCFTNRSKVLKRREEHRFLKKNSRDEYEPSISRCDLRRPIARNCRIHSPWHGPRSP